MLIGHLFLIHTFSKTSKMASIIPILRMRKLTCPMSPSQPWGSWQFCPGLTLLYAPNKTGNKRHFIFYPSSQPGPVHQVHRESSVNVCGQTIVMRTMIKLKEPADEGVEKEDLRSKGGDPQETSNKTQQGELFAFAMSHLIYQSSGPRGARDQI